MCFDLTCALQSESFPAKESYLNAWVRFPVEAFFSANLHVNPICINPKPSHGAAPAQHTARRRHGTQCGAGTASRCPMPPTMSPIHRISGELLAVGAAHAAARARVDSALGVLRAALLLLLCGLGCHGGREKLAKGSPPTKLSSGPQGR